MMTPTEIQHKLRRDLYTITDDYDITIDNRLYTEEEYENLKDTLLTLHELGMAPQDMQQLLAVNA
ncbi:hypothetical protein FC99_GL002042 [Levilactobacillus koreensis JCM 16448]|uniref:Uncharacterized protein n=1 Tax=Levilactobacillus koreensis TaxID=637971 RepID=A0AAC8UUR2_9LACO|nr:hypothetical protein [Levilactobacillus koreensis]AKP64866.1 hypothetical protein ABN16_07550 [Levilactobacillus koreensis]KRK85950.1 hypothetical protein FC99_GL002042 [Levilactobacillus koreensis JCM 16448]